MLHVCICTDCFTHEEYFPLLVVPIHPAISDLNIMPEKSVFMASKNEFVYVLEYVMIKE